ncbi:MAG: hypothetical protein ACXAC6_14725 [Candidatus Hodarchaeales archaeon]
MEIASFPSLNEINALLESIHEQTSKSFTYNPQVSSQGNFSHFLSVIGNLQLVFFTNFRCVKDEMIFRLPRNTDPSLIFLLHLYALAFIQFDASLNHISFDYS